VPAIFAYDIFPTKIVDQLAKEANVTVVETLSNNNLLGNDLLGILELIITPM
jgi:ABC-type Zn uptake system ZnuABC Zn-binding protein ZnuA